MCQWKHFTISLVYKVIGVLSFLIIHFLYYRYLYLSLIRNLSIKKEGIMDES
ncbi:hypothetical protein HMPREF9374_3607 [Desmospora sp. 8437]|nr:hypothetical protein HMPREF9374_3607 [Desmospora sp. 8437]